MVYLATVLVECSLKSRRSFELFNLYFEGTRPAIYLESHLVFKDSGFRYLRESN